jgi:hypothetical protein
VAKVIGNPPPTDASKVRLLVESARTKVRAVADRPASWGGWFGPLWAESPNRIPGLKGLRGQVQGGIYGLFLGLVESTYDNVQLVRHGRETTRRAAAAVAEDTVIAGAGAYVGAEVGALVGSVIPIPILGTVIGCTVGAAVGYGIDRYAHRRLDPELNKKFGEPSPA